MLCNICEELIKKTDRHIIYVIEKFSAVAKEYYTTKTYSDVDASEYKLYEFDLSLFSNYCPVCGHLIKITEDGECIRIKDETKDIVSKAQEKYERIYTYGGYVFRWGCHAQARIMCWHYLYNNKEHLPAETFFTQYRKNDAIEKYHENDIKREFELFVLVNYNNPSGKYIINGINYAVYESYEACYNKMLDENLYDKYLTEDKYAEKSSCSNDK